jgi:hypothetical protein
LDLAAHQQALLELLGNDRVRPLQAADREYLQEVADSNGLRVLREIVRAWETYDVRRSCPLTTIALEHGEKLEQTVAAAHFETSNAYLESRRALFLDTVARTETGVVRSVALFEHALYAVRDGDPSTHSIRWERDPTVIINGLLEGRWLADSAPEGRYRTIVAAGLPGYVSVERDEQVTDARAG